MKFSGKAGSGPVNKWLNFGGYPGYCLDTDCFLDSSLLVDTESGINRLPLRDAAVLGRHRHSNYDVITSWVVGKQEKKTFGNNWSVVYGLQH